MDQQTKQTVQTIRRVKHELTDEERLQGWQEACAEKGFSGEFVLAAKINGEAYTEEQVKMVSELFGR
ncbi:hypothetical protein [Neisseria zalophi]|uniref:Uncharacterized protein n=1 Tax=Neisseria zalophi TaxID=640030 RepID=A0A5J6PSW5_9NEIS|nr:hypothetical protein [Neisseria zalophi]QEY25595.1 hypothetical protein D0T92_02945 [Neisseria zalophi]